jgi:hypothetical protein
VSNEAGIPTWLLVVWWLLCGLVAAGVWWLVLVVAAFGCDSGWRGCENVAAGVVLGYAAVAGGALIGLLVWALVRPTRKVRITSFLLMPLAVLGAAALAVGAYWMFAQALA